MDDDQKPVVDFADFQKIDIRIGRITEVLPFPRARNPSYKVAVDLGREFLLAPPFAEQFTHPGKPCSQLPHEISPQYLL